MRSFTIIAGPAIFGYGSMLVNHQGLSMDLVVNFPGLVILPMSATAALLTGLVAVAGALPPCEADHPVRGSAACVNSAYVVGISSISRP